MAWLRPTLALALAVSVGPTVVASTSAATVPFMATPPVPLAKCRAIAALRPACPEAIPEVPGWAADARRFPGSGFSAWDISRGLADAADPADGRPPNALHVTLVAGRVGNLMGGFDFPRSGRARRVRDGMLRERRAEAVFLGRRTWSCRTGILVLAPPFAAGGGALGNHLILRWRQDGRTYALSLHGWEPFTETVRALRRIVTSLPAADGCS